MHWVFVVNRSIYKKGHRLKLHMYPCVTVATIDTFRVTALVVLQFSGASHCGIVLSFSSKRLIISLVLMHIGYFWIRKKASSLHQCCSLSVCNSLDVSLGECPKYLQPHVCHQFLSPVAWNSLSIFHELLSWQMLFLCFTDSPCACRSNSHLLATYADVREWQTVHSATL